MKEWRDFSVLSPNAGLVDKGVNSVFEAGRNENRGEHLFREETHTDEGDL